MFRKGAKLLTVLAVVMLTLPTIVFAVGSDVGGIMSLWWKSIWLMLIIATGMLSFFGLKLMLSGFDSPEQRTELKDYFKNFIYLLIFGFLSAVVYSLLIQMSGAMSTYLIGGGSIEGLVDFWGSLGDVLLNEELVKYFSMGSLFASITISMQRILLVLGFIMLPLAVGLMFMGFSKSLKTLGYSILTFFFIVVFLPLVDSLIFVSANFAISISEDPQYIVIAAFWLVGIVNLLTFKAAFEVARSGVVAHTVVEKIHVVRERFRGAEHGI